MSEPIRMSREEWIAKGKALYGEDMLHWKFRCPACGHVQTPEDFRPYKDQGATPDSATFMCIGRYDGHMDVDMGTGQPCNYTGMGLIRLAPLVVDGRHCFAFADPAEGG